MSAILAILLMLGGVFAVFPLAHAQVGSCSPNVPPLYPTPPSANIRFEWTTNGTPGSTFVVHFMAYDVSPNDGIAGYSVGFFFNPTLLQVVSITNGSALNPYVSGSDYTYIPGKITTLLAQ